MFGDNTKKLQNSGYELVEFDCPCEKSLQQEVNRAAGLDTNFSKALRFMHEYLKEKGWVSYDYNKDLNMIGYIVDPLTAQPHRGDFAFFIQTERDILELNKK